MRNTRLIQVADYKPVVGREAIERICEKAKRLHDRHVTNVSSTYYGGGVAEILSSLTLLMNDLGIKTGWRIIQGAPDFFRVTKKMHNALQGDRINLTALKKRIYEHVNFENSVRNHLESHDIVIVHDPQPLFMIKHYRRKGPWIWRCHLDLSAPDSGLWTYVAPVIDQYDAVILTVEEYKLPVTPPQVFFMPAIDPFLIKNREMSEQEMERRLQYYKIPTDLPLVVQVSRFDRWKDPQGVIRAHKLARKRVDCRLVLLGNAATDDPEGEAVFESLLRHRDDRTLILPYGDDTALVNALQRRAAVVLQKSLREGFGLTVAEAMWKGTPVIGGDVGGIRRQIQDGENGFLVSSVEQAAERIVQVLTDGALRARLGAAAKETVRKRFLITRLLEQYLDLFNSFRTVYQLGAPEDAAAGI
jgi:trehalose synthase